MIIAQAFEQEITWGQRLAPLAAALAVALVSLELIRRRKLREEYAILWICASVGLLVFAMVPQLLLWIAQTVGVYYITVVMLLGFSFLALVIIHLAVAVSRSADDTRKMAQRIALLEDQLRKILGDRPDTPDKQQ